METVTAPRTLPIETVTPIKPSEAIRLGILRKPRQAFGAYHQGRYAACVVGAAYVGWHGRMDHSRIGSMELRLAEMGINARRCPECGSDLPVLIHLNDDHRWSRERIADWLEGLGL